MAQAPTPNLADESEEEYAARLRAQGVPEEVIGQLIAAHEDPTDIARQYGMSKYLRASALAPDSSKNIFGAAAQGISGYLAGSSEGDYLDRMKAYRNIVTGKRRAAMDAQFPRKPKSTTSSAEIPYSDEWPPLEEPYSHELGHWDNAFGILEP